MDLKDLTCFSCGNQGHLARDCPADDNETDKKRKPPWCGNCDRITRLIQLGAIVTRCQECHPLQGVPLPQHDRCPGCHMVIHSWDNHPCGQHSSPAAVRDRRPTRQQIDAIITAAT